MGYVDLAYTIIKLGAFMLAVLCVSIVIYWVFICYLLATSSAAMRRQEWYAICAVVCIIGTLLASNIEPPSTWDLKWHYLEISNLRANGQNAIWSYVHYETYFLVRAIYSLVSLLPSNKYLVILSLGVELAIILFLSNRASKKLCNRSANTVSISFILSIALLDVCLAISGFRNILAFGICSMAVFFDYFEQNRKIVKWVLYILPVFLHPASLIYLISRILSSLKNKYAKGLLCISMVPIMGWMGKLLMSTNIELAQSIGQLMSYYNATTYRTMQINIPYLMINLSLVIIIAFMNIRNMKRLSYIVSNDGYSKYGEYLGIFTLITLGSLSTPIVFGRMVSGFAFLSIPAVILYFGKTAIWDSSHGKAWLFLKASILACSLVLLLLQSRELWNAVFIYK